MYCQTKKNTTDRAQVITFSSRREQQQQYMVNFEILQASEIAYQYIWHHQLWLIKCSQAKQQKQRAN
jgi:hypothetical protein